MTFWIIAVIVLIGQETISTSALFVVAYTQNYNVVILTSIFVLVTIIQILIFHSLGLILQTRRQRNLITDMPRIYILKSDQFINRWGIKVFLAFLASSVFPPCLTSLLSSWFILPFRIKFISILLGDCIWYITTWIVVIGTSLLTENHGRLLIRTIVFSLIFVIFQRRISNQLLSGGMSFK